MKKRKLSELKAAYQKPLVRAQRKFRRERKRESQSIEFQEAVRTGGQFSFKGLKTEGEFYSELTRIFSYLNTKLEGPDLFVENAHKRATPYEPLFRRGMSKEERSERDLADNMDIVYRVYRMIQEWDPAAIQKGGIFESDAFIAYLYSYHVEGYYDEDELLKRGQDLISEIRAMRQEKFSSDIPVTQFNRGGR